MVRRPPSRERRREQRFAVAGLGVGLAVSVSVIVLAWMQLPGVPPLQDPDRVALVRGSMPSTARAATAPAWKDSRTGGRAVPMARGRRRRMTTAAIPGTTPIARCTTSCAPAPRPRGPGRHRAMPAFGKVLTDDEIWAVLAFIQSQWTERTRRAQQEIDRRAAGRRP